MLPEDYRRDCRSSATDVSNITVRLAYNRADVVLVPLPRIYTQCWKLQVRVSALIVAVRLHFRQYPIAITYRGGWSPRDTRTRSV